MRPVQTAALIAATLVAALPAKGQQLRSETSLLAGQRITLYLHPFLTAEDLAVLRLVASNEQALSVLITRNGQHAALAVAPAEGFVRGGQPAPSASALSDLPSPDAARTAALEVCERSRQSGPRCVVILEVAPAR